MLTFEDFFVRKKIDLIALKQSNLPLYEEFKSHYNAMGEKSFDHSKKFWFNKLRKNYKLQEIENSKPIQTLTSFQADVAKEGNNPVLGPEPNEIASKTIISKISTETTNEQQQAKESVGFKPRFKAGTTKSATTEKIQEEESESNAADETSIVTKPTGFKPRFKAGTTKSVDSDTKENDQ